MQAKREMVLEIPVDQVNLRLHRSVDLAPPGYTTPTGMCREEFRAMGTSICLLLPEHQAKLGFQIVRPLFNKWEQILSRFLPESELSQLNRRPGESVPVSRLLYRVLTTALQAARDTQGLYDPALLDQLVRLGYDRSFDELADRESLPFDSGIAAEPGGRWRGIQVDPMQQSVTLPVGIKLDFGGIAKGMAVDAALEELRLGGVTSALVNAGGDLSVLGFPPGQQQWQVAVPGWEKCWTIPLRRGAVATSGIAHRHWWRGQVLQHHLLDPRTGRPAENDLWSVTAVADCCEHAEVVAKVAFILGSRAGADFLRRHHIPGLLVHKNSTWETIEPLTAQLMEEL